MRTEVEIKAWVDDLVGLRARIAARFPHAGSYTKRDVYYRMPGGGPPVEFRLRVEGDDSVVTAKRKAIVAGVEINEEMEFSVSEGEEFDRFARYLGAEVFSRKHKEGDRYRAADATIELSSVERLGDFIEIERLLEDATPEEIRAAESAVRSLLSELAIPEERIEPRYYTDLLAGLDR